MSWSENNILSYPMLLPIKTLHFGQRLWKVNMVAHEQADSHHRLWIKHYIYLRNGGGISFAQNPGKGALGGWRQHPGAGISSLFAVTSGKLLSPAGLRAESMGSECGWSEDGMRMDGDGMQVCDQVSSGKFPFFIWLRFSWCLTSFSGLLFSCGRKLKDGPWD